MQPPSRSQPLRWDIAQRIRQAKTPVYVGDLLARHGKYQPHQGAQEKARRRTQMARAHAKWRKI